MAIVAPAERLLGCVDAAFGRSRGDCPQAVEASSEQAEPAQATL